MPGPEELARLTEQIGPLGDRTLYRGAGCRECRQTGFRGRSALAELLGLDDTVRNLILQRASEAQIRNAASGRMLTMREAGCRKVLRGITTAEEVLRVTQLDEVYDEGPDAPQE